MVDTKTEVTKLRSERVRRGWSLLEVARRTGITPGDVSMVERGLRPAFPGWRRRLARAFQMSEQALFGDLP